MTERPNGAPAKDIRITEIEHKLAELKGAMKAIVSEVQTECDHKMIFECNGHNVGVKNRVCPVCGIHEGYHIYHSYSLKHLMDADNRLIVKLDSSDSYYTMQVTV